MKNKSKPKEHYDPQRRRFTLCHANDDGDCEHKDCPQLRDGEPKTSGRSCPLDRECIYQTAQTGRFSCKYPNKANTPKRG